jgi:hypothetical protein
MTRALSAFRRALGFSHVSSPDAPWRNARCAPAAAVLVTSSLAACLPDIESLRGPSIGAGGTGGTSGTSGCQGGDCSGSGGADAGGTGGSGDISMGGSDTAPVGGSGGSSPAGPQLRHDFEEESLGLQGWIPVNPQRPAGVQDRIEWTAEAAHSGTHSIRMVYNGSYPDAGVPTADPFWGIQRSGGPPADAEVRFWIMTTASGVSVEAFAQTGVTFTWNILANVPLLPNEWTEFVVFIPPASAGALSNWGMKIYGPLNMEGYIYMDEVSW